MAQLLHRAGEVHLREEAGHQGAAESVVLGPGGARGEGEHLVLLVIHVEHQDGAHARRLARRGGQPAARDRREAPQIDVGRDDVVLRDDQLVEAVDALVREGERGVEHGLPPRVLDLQRGAEREAAEHEHGQDDRRHQREVEELLA